MPLDSLAMIFVQSLFLDQAQLPKELAGGILRAWSVPLLPLCGLTLMTVIYLRGFALARRTRPLQLPLWRAASFLLGVLSLWIALASPIDALDDFLLTAHMLQHFILMSVAPPLLILGAPQVPMLRGVPGSLTRTVMPVLVGSRFLRRASSILTHPVAIWIAANAAYLGWHIPAAFESTFRSEFVHNIEHLCFFVTSLGFWWFVLNPWPSHPVWPRWTVIPFLLSSDILNTVLSAFLTFSGRVLYPTYSTVPRITRLTPLQDQIAAGAGMWVVNSVVFLVPATVIIVRLLSPNALRRAQPQETSG